MPQIAAAQSPFSTEILRVSETLEDLNNDGEIDRLGEVVTIAGRANIDSYTLNSQLITTYIQDHKAGVLLFSGTNKTNISLGDSVIVRGKLQLYYGKPEVNIDTLLIVDVPPQPPKPIPLNEVIRNPEKHLGMLAKGTAIVSRKSASSGYRGITVSLTDSAESALEVYISQSHKYKDDFGLQLYSVGDEIELTGIVGKFVFESKNIEVYQLLPRTPDDIKSAGFPLRFYRIGVWVIAFLVILITGWIYSLKKQVNSQTKELSKALEEKEILMQEIHHRVKNNLAKISALLDLQISTTDEPAVEESLTNSKSRINSMVLIHDKLYQTQEYQVVQLDNYLRELITTIYHTYNDVENDIELKFNLTPEEISVDRAVIFGLLANELIVNAFKYAFSKNDSGKLEISLHKSVDELIFSVSDNGPGLPDVFDKLIGKGLGSILIKNFAEQLNAEMHVKSDESGTTFTFTCTK